MSKRSILLVLGLWAPLPAAAQSLVGTVVERDSRRPVVGAMVRLLVDSAWTGVLYLTAGDGRFALRAPASGTYSVLVERIGFAATTAGPFTLTTGETATREVAVETAPVRLEGLEVRGQDRRCGLARGGGDATQLLWQEARKALAAATWTEREGGLRFRVSARQRQLDPRTTAVMDEERRVLTLYGANSVRSLPPGELAERGYVQEVEGQRYFYGPDAETLLSDAFLSTHCFGVAGKGNADEAHLVGLRFEPIRGRDVADVKGVLWMDRASSRLDRIDFEYTGVDLGPGNGLATGQVRFAELGDGHWIVRDWYIRAPLLLLQRGFAGRFGEIERTSVAALAETGTAVVAVSGPGIEWNADDPPGRVVGTVFDSISGRMLAGAEVRLAGRGWRTVADSDGRFELNGVPAGAYRIAFSHPRLDSLALNPWWSEVEVRSGGDTGIALAIPGGAALLSLHCPQDRGIVVGRVIEADDGAALEGAVVSIVSPMEGTDVPLSGVSTSEGDFWMCGLPRATRVRLVARLGAFASAPVDVDIGSEGYARIDLRITTRRPPVP